MINHNKLEAFDIHHAFQPLWKLNNWFIYGYESFLRTNSQIELESIFSQAREKQYLYELDTLSIKKAIEVFPYFTSKNLFLNIFPSTVLHEDFPRLIEELVLSHPHVLNRVIFELNESSQEEHIWDIPLLKEKINWLQKMGFSIALDDIGKGAASLQKIIEFQPQFIKLDRYFANDFSESKQKQKMVSLLSQYCLEENITLVMEGIEKPMDLALAKLINVSVGQGYLIGRPSTL